GCIFPFTLLLGEDRGFLPNGRPPAGLGQQTSANRFTFEAFPRKEKVLRLRLLDMRSKKVVELAVRNPAPHASPAHWNARALPATAKDGGASFTLSALTARTNFALDQPGAWLQYHAWPRDMTPTFDIREDGVPSKGWEAVDMQLSDSYGNCAPKYYVWTRYW